MKNEIYFHGTRKAFLKSLLEEGLKTKYGRATFTTNPLYASYYSSELSKGSIKKADTKPIIKEGILVVFKIPKNVAKIAKNSHIIFKKNEKIITGWPNRYKREQHGYYTLKRRKYVCLNKKYAVGIFSYNKHLLETLEKIKYKIVEGKINEKYIKYSIRILEKILSSKNIQLIKPKASLIDISYSAIYGMLRNEILHEIRQSELSIFFLKGWKINNTGDHPVKLKDKAGIKQSIRNIGNIIDKKFVSKDVRQEYYKLVKLSDSGKNKRA